MDNERQSPQQDWRPDFLEECKSSLQMSVDDRIRFGFTCEYKPILDDAPWRSFDSMEEYRLWCEEDLLKHLGRGLSDEADQEALDKKIALAARREINRRKKLRLSCKHP